MSNYKYNRLDDISRLTDDEKLAVGTYLDAQKTITRSRTRVGFGALLIAGTYFMVQSIMPDDLGGEKAFLYAFYLGTGLAFIGLLLTYYIDFKVERAMRRLGFSKDLLKQMLHQQTLFEKMHRE